MNGIARWRLFASHVEWVFECAQRAEGEQREGERCRASFAPEEHELIERGARRDARQRWNDARAAQRDDDEDEWFCVSLPEFVARSEGQRKTKQRKGKNPAMAIGGLLEKTKQHDKARKREQHHEGRDVTDAGQFAGDVPKACAPACVKVEGGDGEE